ncbi:putative transcription factor FAR family [Helianthus annuus]|nr:putative transcription factor FAR family [Helianthus annuus]
MTPVVGMVFDTVDAAYIFYKAYAQTGGWTVRKGTEHTNHGVTVNKYFVCSKEGHKVFKPVDTLSDQPPKRWVRRVPSKRTGCQAEFRIKLNDDKKYVLYYFTEAHNHAFVHEEDLHFLRENRSLTRSHEDMIKKMSNLNIGPVRAFNIMKELCGGFDNVGATKCDFKNFKKELNVFIGEFDAEMLVKRLTRKKEFLPNFTCEYQTTEEGVLKCLFWADEDMKRNFYMFGDVVSLMPRTSETSKYNMMFVPFTGIDNHNRNVTLGASIIGPETAETYSWLLNVCKDAFGYAPRVIVTDQDPAMKRAIEDVWPDSRHRLCMWHIMDKLTTKVGPTICANTDFRKRLSAIVWTDSLLPEAFETEWAAVLNEFNLSDHEWLVYIYMGFVSHGSQRIIVKKKCRVLCARLPDPKARTISLVRFAIPSVLWWSFSATSTRLLRPKGTSTVRTTTIPVIVRPIYGILILFLRNKHPRHIPERFFLMFNWKFNTVFTGVLASD